MYIVGLKRCIIVRAHTHTAPGTITFEQSQFISSEELGWAVLCASLSGPPPSSSFSLAVSTFDGTASEPNEGPVSKYMTHFFLLLLLLLLLVPFFSSFFL